MPHCPAPSPLDATLRSLAQELADLRDLALRLELLVVTLDRRADATLIGECQAADLLTQRLAGACAFADALAGLTPSGLHVDVGAATHGLTLSDQARRLRGEVAAPAEPVSLTLFED